MKALIVSDSHGDSGIIRSLLNRYEYEAQLVIHLGDNVKDLMQFDSDYPGINFVAVAGNCDYYTTIPNERILTIGNSVKRQVLLLHGHKLNVKSDYGRLIYYAQEKGVDACLFGHTHTPFVHVHEPVFLVDGEEKPRRQLIMNPGSVSLPRGGSVASCALLCINDEGDITVEVIEI